MARRGNPDSSAPLIRPFGPPSPLWGEGLEMIAPTKIPRRLEFPCAPCYNSPADEKTGGISRLRGDRYQ